MAGMTVLLANAQDGFRGRTVNATTAAANAVFDGSDPALNTNFGIDVDTVFRLRIHLQGNADVNDVDQNLTYVLRYSRNGGAYSPVFADAAEPVIPAGSPPSYVEDTASSQAVGSPTGSGSFRAGGVTRIDAQVVTLWLASGQQHTLHEFALILKSSWTGGTAANGDTFDFRIYRPDGQTLPLAVGQSEGDQYTSTPRVTAAVSTGPVTHNADAALAATGGLVATTIKRTDGAAELAATAGLTADAIVVGGAVTHDADATLAATAGLAAAAQEKRATKTHPVGIGHGFYTEPTTSVGFDAYEQLIGERPRVVMFYWQIGSPAWNFPALAGTIAARGQVPMISLGTEPYTNAQILAGDADADWAAWADDAIAHGGPILLRFGWEANGDWYGWNGPDFPAVWAHVQDIFIARGATNVQWVWSPNVVSGSNVLPLADVFPGDDRIDIAALDGYNWGTSQVWSSWQTFTQVFDQSITDLRQLTNKPLWIGEVACSEVGGDKAAWITDMFSQLHTRTIERFDWFYLEKETDWRVDSSPESLAAFKAGLLTLPVTLAATSALSADADVVKDATASVEATGQLSAEAIVVGGAQTYDATGSMEASAGLDADAVVARSITGSLEATASLTVDLVVIRAADASLAATAGLEAVTEVSGTASLDETLDVTAALTATVAVTHAALATLDATAGLSTGEENGFLTVVPVDATLAVDASMAAAAQLGEPPPLVDLHFIALAPELSHGPALASELVVRAALAPELAHGLPGAPETAARAVGVPVTGHGEPGAPETAHGQPGHDLTHGDVGEPTV